MLLKIRLRSENRKKYIAYLGGASQAALVTGILLSRIDIPGFDFVEGLLIGFSMVGNLTFIIYYLRNRSEK